MAPAGQSKAPTILDIATEAGVSKSAVSRALLGQGEVSQATRDKVQLAATRLGYVANAMARGLVSSKTKTLGVVLRDVTRPFYTELYAAMQRRAEHAGYRIVTETSAGELDIADALSALRNLISLQVDGLIIASAQLSSDQITPFIDRVPMVVAGRKESNASVSSVYCDDADGGHRLADHLAEMGHRRVAVALVDSSYSLSQHTRGAAMVERLREHGIEAEVHEVEDDAATRTIIGTVLENEFVTALMCPTDAAVMDVLEALRIRGRSAPTDLSVTGYDGLAPLNAPFLGLTTFRQPVSDMGSRAVDLLLETIEDRTASRRHIPLTGHLVPGRTSAPQRS